MKKKKLILILIFFYLLSIKVSSMETLDLYYPLLPEANEFKGNIYLRDVKNKRTYLRSKNDVYYIGHYTVGFGLEPTGSTINVEDLVRGMVTESLEYSGYKVSNKKLNNASVMDVEIIQMNSIMPYMYIGELKLLMYTEDGKKIMEKTVFDYVGHGWSINEVFKGFTRVAIKSINKLVLFFNSDSFNDCYNGKPYFEKEKEIIKSSQRLSAIPNDIQVKPDIVSVTFYENNIKKIENLENFKNIEVLDLFENQIKKIKNLDQLANLKFLNLKSNLIPVIENLDKLTGLIDLDLHFNELTKIENLNNLTNLLWLCFNHNKITKIENLKDLSNLTFLDISFNKIGKIENLNNLKNLLWLDLSSNNINKIENLDQLSNLYYLNFSRNENIVKIENLNNLKNLHVLDLAETKVSKIENLNELKKLEILILYDTKIKTLENVEELTNLKRIWVPNSTKKIAKKSYDFLKKNNVLINGMSVDQFVKKPLVKVE
ncbi:MAG: leucine-rich repeat domain-containing protein [Fusobacteriaceae bacterium]|nr:leucine-rich repeat domain-containing protein [Fusobacteriaceae bacterium]